MIFLCVPVSAGDESQILEIDNVILHPKYDLSNAYQDISVIKLKPNKGKFYINIMSQKHIYPTLNLSLKLLVSLFISAE